MNTVTILFPIVSTYITTTFCPRSTTLNRANESPLQETKRTIVWPIMSSFIGFAWLLSRTKAIEVAQNKSSRVVTKGARRAAQHISDILKTPTSTVIDIAYMILIALINLYLWLKMCEHREQDATYALLAIFVAILIVNYLVGSYTSSSLMLMTPMLMYAFILLQEEGVRIYNEYTTQTPTQKTENKIEEAFKLW